jgi:hypothetical protein
MSEYKANQCAADDSVFASSIADMKLQLPDMVGSGLIKRQLLDATRRFCIHSEIWRYVFELVQVVENEVMYRIPEVEESKPVRIVDVFMSDSCCAGKGEAKMPRREDVWRDCSGHQFWYESEPGLIILNQTPEEAMTLRANVVLRPIDNSERVPVEVYQRWREWIEYGAYQKLYMMPQKDWSDPKLAQAYYALYNEGVNKAKNKHLHNLGSHRPSYCSPYGL